MKKKLVFIAVSLAAGLAAIAWVFLAGGPQGPAAPAGRESSSAASDSAAGPRPAGVGQKSAGGPAASAAEAELVIRSTETTGDLTMSRLRGGDLGYVDAGSIIDGNDPYSIVAFLQAQSELTGADESLEIEIRNISDYPASIRARFDQIIDGKRSPQGKGSVSFDPATGAVISSMTSLVAPDPALAGSVAILQAEAVAIAREAVTSAVLQEEAVAITRDGDRLYVQPRLRPGFTFQISRVTPKEIRYALDPATNKTRAEWPVWIGARGVAGGLSWEVLVDASTGEIVGINDLVQRYAGGCSDLTFLVCDGSLMRDEDDECGTGILNRVKPLPDSDPDAASAIRYAKGMTTDVKAANSSYIGEAQGSDCEVEIVVNVPEDLMGNDAGQYDSSQDRILLREDEIDTQTRRVIIHATQDVVAHEVMHALSTTPSGGVEHGLVSAAESLHTGYGWSYGNKDFTIQPTSMSSDMHAGVAHAMYRIYEKVGKDMAFKIVLETDLAQPSSGNAYMVISEVGGDLGVGTEVDEVLGVLGVGPLSEELKKLQAQAEAEGLSHTTIARLTQEMTIRQIIDWLIDWLRNREIDEAEK